MAKKKIDLKKWHKAVLERDGYICRGCQQDYSFDCYFQDGVNQYLCGHHILSQKAYPELRLDISNGVCLCFSCHEKVHRGLLKVSNENVTNNT